MSCLFPNVIKYFTFNNEVSVRGPSPLSFLHHLLTAHSVCQIAKTSTVAVHFTCSSESSEWAITNNVPHGLESETLVAISISVIRAPMVYIIHTVTLFLFEMYSARSIAIINHLKPTEQTVA